MLASAMQLLERDGFTVCGEASDADGAVEAAFREGPGPMPDRRFRRRDLGDFTA
jgi:hypothetical protein